MVCSAGGWVNRVPLGLVPSLAVLLLVWCARPASGQVEIEARTASIEVGGRVHAQMVSSTADDGHQTDFVLRRARLTFDVAVNDFLDGRVQPDFEKSTLRLKDAYFRLNFDPAFRISAGNLKRAFDLFQLVSSTQLPVIERDGEIPGVSDCAGPHGTCSFGRFSEDLDYSDRDTGVRVDGAFESQGVSYMATVTNGTGGASPDENSAKSFAGRIVVDAGDNVRVATNLSVHDYDHDSFENQFAAVWGGDVEIGDFAGGLHVMMGVMYGDNWMNPTSPEGEKPDPATLASAQGIISYKHELEGSTRFEAVEPLFRVSWGDPDRSSADDGAVLITPGVQLFVEGRNKIAANLDVYRTGAGSTEVSVKVQSYLYF